MHIHPRRIYCIPLSFYLYLSNDLSIHLHTYLPSYLSSSSLVQSGLVYSTRFYSTLLYSYSTLVYIVYSNFYSFLFYLYMYICVCACVSSIHLPIFPTKPAIYKCIG